MSDDAKKEATRLKNALARRVKKLIAQTLEPQGFKKEPKPPRWVREGKTLAHGCIFVLHYNQFFVASYFSFRFRCDFLRNPPSEMGDRAQWEEVLVSLNDEINDEICGEIRKSWPLPQTEEELETTVNEVEKYFNDVVLPYYERWRDSSVVVREYDAGNITRKKAFGASEEWQFLRLGLSRLEAERYAEAAACFEEAATAAEDSVASHTAWVAARMARVRKIAAQELAEEERFQAFWSSFIAVARYNAEEARRRQKSS